jgi:hypothetical protein
MIRVFVNQRGRERERERERGAEEREWADAQSSDMADSP